MEGAAKMAEVRHGGLLRAELKGRILSPYYRLTSRLFGGKGRIKQNKISVSSNDNGNKNKRNGSCNGQKTKTNKETNVRYYAEQNNTDPKTSPTRVSKQKLVLDET